MSFQLRVCDELRQFARTVLLLWIHFRHDLICIISLTEALHSQLDLLKQKKVWSWITLYLRKAKYNIFVRGKLLEWTYFDTQAISASVLKIIWSVLLLWTVSPLTKQRTPRLWGSGKFMMQEVNTYNPSEKCIFSSWSLFVSPFTASVVTNAGPSGQKLSKVFPSSHCFPLRFICQSRALTSLATVNPAT